MGVLQSLLMTISHTYVDTENISFHRLFIVAMKRHSYKDTFRRLVFLYFTY